MRLEEEWGSCVSGGWYDVKGVGHNKRKSSNINQEAHHYTNTYHN